MSFNSLTKTTLNGMQPIWNRSFLNRTAPVNYAESLQFGTRPTAPTRKPNARNQQPAGDHFSSTASLPSNITKPSNAFSALLKKKISLWEEMIDDKESGEELKSLINRTHQALVTDDKSSEHLTTELTSLLEQKAQQLTTKRNLDFEETFNELTSEIKPLLTSKETPFPEIIEHSTQPRTTMQPPPKPTAGHLKTTIELGQEEGEDVHPHQGSKRKMGSRAASVATSTQGSESGTQVSRKLIRMINTFRSEIRLKLQDHDSTYFRELDLDLRDRYENQKPLKQQTFEDLPAMSSDEGESSDDEANERMDLSNAEAVFSEYIQKFPNPDPLMQNYRETKGVFLLGRIYSNKRSK